MYESFYGLRERPFELTPNPRFLFMTPGHREALSTIQYGMTGGKGVTLLVGAAGTGKTTLVHAALQRQQGSNAHPIFLTNPTLSRADLVEFLALELGFSDAAAQSKTRFLRELTTTLTERRAAGIVTALIVDEAHAMPDELLEEIRLLANMETPTDKLLPVVLVGQVELAERLNERALLPLKQRVALRSSLAPLSEQEAAAYVTERIRIAGGDVRSIFRPDALEAIYIASAGIPRTISVICDNALVAGFALDEQPIGRAVIAEIARDFDLPVPGAGPVASTPAPAPGFIPSGEVISSIAATPAAPGIVEGPAFDAASSMFILPQAVQAPRMPFPAPGAERAAAARAAEASAAAAADNAPRGGILQRGVRAILPTRGLRSLFPKVASR